MRRSCWRDVEAVTGADLAVHEGLADHQRLSETDLEIGKTITAQRTAEADRSRLTDRGLGRKHRETHPRHLRGLRKHQRRQFLLGDAEAAVRLAQLRKDVAPAVRLLRAIGRLVTGASRTASFPAIREFPLENVDLLKMTFGSRDVKLVHVTPIAGVYFPYHIINTHKYSIPTQ